MVFCFGAVHREEGEGKKNPMSSALKTVDSILCAPRQGRAPLNPEVPRNFEKETAASSPATSEDKSTQTLLKTHQDLQKAQWLVEGSGPTE